MEQVAEKGPQEYWRPAVPQRSHEIPLDVRSRSEVCENCGTEFVVGARFCHVCGGERQAAPSLGHRWLEVLDFENIRHALGLSTASLVVFVFGAICALAALVTGFIYQANTLVNWQAVQVWRIEWLLAALVCFVCGILLKRPEA